MTLIDPLGRVPSWCNKLASDERLRREAEQAFHKSQRLGHDRCLRVRFWQGVAGVLAVVVVTLAIMLCSRSAS
jgi:hypothetical protein